MQQPRKPVRVTADLPPPEFKLLDTARKTHKGSTTDITRALLRLLVRDEDLAGRVDCEIAQMRLERAHACLEAKRAVLQTRAVSAEEEETGEEVAVMR